MHSERTLGQLTRYPTGSICELCAISAPLMLSLASVCVMVFTDRFFLSQLSLEAFSAASEAAMFFIVFEYSFVSLAATAEVYVGRMYGAGKDSCIAKPCWAMLWMSMFSSLVFIPTALFASDAFFASSCYPELCSKFFRSLMYFGPFLTANMALVSFWVGRGKTRFVMLLTLLANIINIALDPILIFGLYGFPSYGIEGACYATGISQIIQIVVLLCAFLKESNRKAYGTGQWNLDMKSMWECLSLGAPLMLTVFVQASAWSLIARFMSLSGPQTLVVWGVVHTAFMLCSFIGDAVGRAVTAISANLIGAGRLREIQKVISSAIALHMIIFFLLFMLFFMMSDQTLRLFIHNYDLMPAEEKRVLFSAMCWNTAITFAEALLYVWAGALTAMGDTRFLGVAGSVLIWIFGVFPAAVATAYGARGDTIIASTMWYYFIGALAYNYRCRLKSRAFFSMSPSKIVA